MGCGADESGEVECRERRRQALEIHDNVVQGLALAKLSFELGDDATGRAALEETLEAARRLVSDLLGDEDEGAPTVDLTDGALRRVAPAGLG